MELHCILLAIGTALVSGLVGVLVCKRKLRTPLEWDKVQRRLEVQDEIIRIYRQTERDRREGRPGEPA